MAKSGAFETYTGEYEAWFSRHQAAFQSELQALKQLLPLAGRGVEIGIGSGLFACQLGISEGIDPAAAMRRKARERGLTVIAGTAEHLPWADGSLDYALMVTTVCFLDDAGLAFKEAHRTLKSKGSFIIGFVEKDSIIGRQHLSRKAESRFYRDARFFSAEEITVLLNAAGFGITQTWQTLFGSLQDIKVPQKPKPGHGQGSFIVIHAEKGGNQ